MFVLCDVRAPIRKRRSNEVAEPEFIYTRLNKKKYMWKSNSTKMYVRKLKKFENYFTNVCL